MTAPNDPLAAEDAPAPTEPSRPDRPDGGSAPADHGAAGLDAAWHPNLVATQVGAALALGSGVAMVLFGVWLSAFPYDVADLRLATVVGAIAVALMVLICLLQWRLWAHAVASVRGPGRHRAGMRGWRRASFVAHVVSYVAVVVGVLALADVAVALPVSTPGLWLAVVAALALIGAQAVGAVQYLRPSGPPGTLPAHVRALVARRNAQVDAELDRQERAETQPGDGAADR